MKTLLASPLLFSSLFILGCSSSGGATSGDAGHTDVSNDAPTDHASSTDGGDAVLSLDPLSVVAGSLHEHEPFIAISPGGRLGVTFTSFLTAGGITVGYRISSDRGANWGPTTLIPIPAGHNEQANASIAAGDDGMLYMSWGSEEHTETGRTNQGVYVASSPPGSTSFGAPVLVTDPSVAVSVYDQPRVSVTHAGVVNLAYNQTSPDGYTSWIQNARSVDGKAWSLTYIAGPGAEESYRNMARFCRPAGGGRIYLMYLDSDVAIYEGDLAVALRYSDDDGASWSLPLDVTDEADELILDPTAAMGCVTSGADVWMVYGLTPIGNLGGTTGGGAAPSASVEHTMTQVRLAHSGNSGQSIDVRSNVLDTRAGSRAMYPVLVGEGDSTLDLSYYVGDADNDPKSGLRRTRSVSGEMFPQTVPVHSPLTLETNRADTQWIGDYVGGAFQGGDLFLVFTDNATPTPHVAFYRTPPELPSGTSEPDAQAPPADAGDAGVCYVGTAFTPFPWAPPTTFGQGACSGAQVSAYLACTNSVDCSTFRSDTTNAGCLSCLETDESAAAHGPFVTQAADGGVAVVEVNYGGCQAHYDGQTAKGCCGEQVNNANDCVDFECATCSDFANPAEYGPTFDCYYAATDDGVCTAYRETTACGDETLDGGSAIECTNPATFVPAWCGN
jgi:hypothetical protein